MKTPEEIKANARTCISQPYTEPCGSCELYPKCRWNVNYILIALLDLVNEYERRLAQVEKERDAAIADLEDAEDGHCCHCKKNDLATKCDFNGECYWCPNEECPCHEFNCRWVWRGVCPENTQEDEESV